ncbi:helix-turn-helix domain-containing protein [Rhodococcus ruber]|uniref:Helix-turn-helix domain-containing protein n=1 Tax=Rhodococcus ruber TaxID=1830 RepID=A0ABT4MKP5_9NOCA|nr:helix-turn-helix domain-containing protein [Rhodococcus ruber]MCZ4521564.1 helix-turn-helix domain-containing protein [Rhodococcus ruber]
MKSKRHDTIGRWRELVEATIRDVDDVVAVFLAEVVELPAYGSNLVGDEDLSATARVAFDLLLEAVRLGTTTGELSTHPGELGRRRARQGVPVKDLIEAVRLDFNIIWSSLLWHATTEDMLVLALHVDELWAVVDDYARAIHQGYLEELAEQATTVLDAQRGYLAELFSPARNVSGNVDRIARALGVSAAGRFSVAVASPDASPALHHAATLMRASGTTIFVLNQFDRVVALWPIGAVHGPASSAVESRLSTLTAGYVPVVDGLAAVPDAADVAYDIVDSLDPATAGLVSVQQGWARMTRGNLDRRIGFTPTILAGLRELPAGERDRVIDTVRVYLDTGSVREAAAALYCHRNTVLNRLTKFHGATGLDVQIPREAALVVLALS